MPIAVNGVSTIGSCQLFTCAPTLLNTRGGSHVKETTQQSMVCGNYLLDQLHISIRLAPISLTPMVFFSSSNTYPHCSVPPFKIQDKGACCNNNTSNQKLPAESRLSHAGGRRHLTDRCQNTAANGIITAFTFYEAYS